jgi:hypothetical protein
VEHRAAEPLRRWGVEFHAQGMVRDRTMRLCTREQMAIVVPALGSLSGFRVERTRTVGN